MSIFWEESDLPRQTPEEIQLLHGCQCDVRVEEERYVLSIAEGSPTLTHEGCGHRLGGFEVEELEAEGIPVRVNPVVEYAYPGEVDVIYAQIYAEGSTPEGGPDLSSCPYFRAYARHPDPGEGKYGPGTCGFHCTQEPACITDVPEGGWPGEADLVREVAQARLVEIVREVVEHGPGVLRLAALEDALGEVDRRA